MHRLALAALAATIGFAYPAQAGNSLPCLVGNPNEVLGKLIAASGEKPLLKFEIETGAEPWPAMIIAKSDGTFSIAVLMHGMACIMAVGHGLAPATVDQLFPVAVLPGKPS